MQFQVKLAVTKNWRCFMVALLLVYFVPQLGQARQYQNCEETPHWDMCRYLATQIISGKWAAARKVIKQHKDVINRLLFRGQTFLVFSAGTGSFEFVELLLDLGADIEARGRSGRTVLSFAASGADMDMVLMLIADYLQSKGAAEQFMNNMGEGYSFEDCPPNRRN